MKTRDMCAMTLLALATELDKDAAFFSRNEEDSDLAARLRGIANRYRKRARLAKGAWSAVREEQAKKGPPR